MFAIAFDLKIEDLESHYPGVNYNNAYAEIQAVLQKKEFQRIQGSVYISKKNGDLANLYEALDALATIHWFSKCVRDIRAFRVENWSDLTPTFKKKVTRSQVQLPLSVN